MLLGFLELRRHPILVPDGFLHIVLDIPPLLDHPRVSLVPPRLLSRVVHRLGLPVVAEDLKGAVLLVGKVQGWDGWLACWGGLKLVLRWNVFIPILNHRLF